MTRPTRSARTAFQLIRIIEGRCRITAEDLETLLDYLGADTKENRSCSS